MNERWRAFGKVNLDLRVLGRRPDGYREIRTTLQAIDLSDEIHVRACESFRFTTTSAPEDESNLVVRAARSFERAAAISPGLHLHLVKRIPAGAGLGGGSADAAVVLMGLNRRFGHRLSGERLMGLLAELGSDVPFFALGGRAVAVGRGTDLFPLHDDTGYWLVLVHPAVRVATAEAYSWLTGYSEFNTMLGFCARFVPLRADAEPAPEARLNDFETPLFRRFPELAEIKLRLSALGARFAGLTGSGSSLFGGFEFRAEADRAAEELGREFDVSLVRPLSRAEYFERMFESGRAGDLPWPGS